MRLLPLFLACLFAACATTDPYGLEKIERMDSVEKLYKQSVADLQGKNLMGGLSETFLTRQTMRIERTRELYQEGKVSSAKDCMYAAALLVSSSLLEDLQLARELGFRASQLGEPRGLPVAAEAIDKLCVALGEPQKYGTQIVYIQVLDRFRLEPVDPATSDEERAAMGLPPRLELEARVERMNQLKQEQGI
jgi:hypothetical protein